MELQEESLKKYFDKCVRHSKVSHNCANFWYRGMDSNEIG